MGHRPGSGNSVEDFESPMLFGQLEGSWTLCPDRIVYISHDGPTFDISIVKYDDETSTYHTTYVGHKRLMRRSKNRNWAGLLDHTFIRIHNPSYCFRFWLPGYSSHHFPHRFDSC